ncbi:MAG: OmpA family protein [Flavobacteriales bacterium]|nr:OmpA family protein [Flavobacteriales bacterium]
MKILLRTLLFAISLVLMNLTGFSQIDAKPSKTEKKLHKQAYNYLDMEMYDEAIKDYDRLLQINPTNPNYNFEMGIAYLRSPKDFDKAEIYMERALKYSKDDTIPELYYYLGKAYQNNHKFAEAKIAYQEFGGNVKDNKAGRELKSEVNWLEKTCQHGEYHVKLNTKNPLENKKKPLNDVKKYYLNATDYVILANLGNVINSVYDDENAVFFNEERNIFYTSKRNPFGSANELTYGDRTFEQVYVSKLMPEGWKTPYLIDHENVFPSAFVDAGSQVSIVSINKQGNIMFLYKNDVLYQSNKDAQTWTTPKPLSNKINLKKSHESSCFLSDDGSTLIVVSDKDGGYGKSDLYTSTKNANGEWGELVNMGSVVNTEQDEESPFLIGNDVLYFSSKGHSSVGGYDVFYSKLKNGTWSNPQSLGIPINTPQDEISYIKSYLDPDVAYYASNRIDGYGYKDIYKISTHYVLPEEDSLALVALGTFKSDLLKTEKVEKEAPEGIVDDASLAVVAPVPVTVDEVAKTEEKVVAPVPVPVEEVKVTEPTPKPVVTKPNDDIFKNILFTFNGNQLTPESQEQVKKIAAYMKSNPDFVIDLAGHADYLGSEEVNMEVSKQRALIVFNELAKDGTNPLNISYSYYGESKPLKPGQNADGSDNPENRRLNRRVEFGMEEYAMYRVILFASSSSSLDNKSNTTLNDVAAYLKSNPNKSVQLSGYSDPSGNAEMNKRLSDKRVESAKNKLVELGVASGKIGSFSYGDQKPPLPGDPGLNRRVEIRIK